jgi:folate-binding protein YgfZ
MTAAAGAVFADEAGWQMPLHFGDAAAEYHRACTAAALFDRSHHGKIQVTGRDAVTFLHNLCTNDIKALKPGSGCESFLTTAKAKIIAHVHVFLGLEQEPHLWIDTEPGLGAVLFKHLDRHLISEQVELNDATRDFAQVYLAGPLASAVLAKAALEGRLRTILGVPGYDVVCPAAGADNIWNVLTAAGAVPAGRSAYAILRVEAGWPVHGLEMDEERFVVEVGRGRQAICYTKGCYLGQEPIVMARDRGHVNRTLLGLRIEGAGAVPTGAGIFRDGADVGRVTSGVLSPRLGAIALAYLRRGNCEPGTVVQVAADGGQRTASVVGLPFEGAGSS